jgi:hypothetical protein
MGEIFAQAGCRLRILPQREFCRALDKIPQVQDGIDVFVGRLVSSQRDIDIVPRIASPEFSALD